MNMYIIYKSDPFSLRLLSSIYNWHRYVTRVVLKITFLDHEKKLAEIFNSADNGNFQKKNQINRPGR